MADDDTEGFAMFGGLPPEVQEQIENAQTKAEMDYIANRERHFNNLETFKEDQLRTLRDILRSIAMIAGSPEDALALAGWYQGYVQAQLQARFHECPACFKDHDKELHKDGSDS